MSIPTAVVRRSRERLPGNKEADDACHGAREGDRTLRVEFSAGPTGVTVSETFDAEETHSVEQQRQGWQAILESFARHVERKVTRDA